MQVAIAWSLIDDIKIDSQPAAGLPEQWLINILAKDVNSLAGRVLLRDLFTLHFPHQPHPDISFAKSGKPYFAHSLLHFSISHSERYVACALSHGHVGLDIEEIKNYDEKLLTKIYTKRQQQFVYNTDNPSRAFFRIWTEREAVFKASDQADNSILSQMEGIGRYVYGKRDWSTIQIDMSEELICSLATSKIDGPPVIHLNSPRVYKNILSGN